MSKIKLAAAAAVRARVYHINWASFAAVEGPEKRERGAKLENCSSLARSTVGQDYGKVEGEGGGEEKFCILRPTGRASEQMLLASSLIPPPLALTKICTEFKF